jgi:NADPH:quinone reductase-like Zn-dependent oxidoreductase
MQKQINTETRYMRAVVTDPQAADRFVLREVPFPIPTPNQALIKVEAFSLNQGETRTAFNATDSYTPGWDFAGVVQKAAADGSTPKDGTRVFGYIARGSWAEYLVAPGGLMAEIPEGVSNAQAATIPIAGLTAMGCLDVSGVMLDRSILITGASGGVGRFACQLAALAGAKVFAISRRPELKKQLQQDGVNLSGVFATIAEAKLAGTYDLIWDSVGGDSLATALTTLSRNGICVNYGNSSRQPTTIDVRTSGWPFHGIQCIWLGREPILNSTPIFNRLVELVKQDRLRPPVDAVLPWTSVAQAAERLLQLQVNGKIVLEVI